MVEVATEQMEALQEKLKKMSPEELKEFQKKQCIFCQIISGKVASKKVYEDDKCIAILDINPANPGHILLLPKEHYPIMPMIPPEETSHLAMVAKALSLACLKALKAQGTNIFIANGIAAGQKAQHFMMHVIPRMEGDGVNLDIVPVQKISREAILELKERLQPRIDAIFGKKKEVAKEARKEIPKPKEVAASKESTEEMFIASKTAKKYHCSDCARIAKISPENRVSMSKEDFEKKGYEPCICITKKRKGTAAKVKREERAHENKAEKEKVNLDDIAGLLK